MRHLSLIATMPLLAGLPPVADGEEEGTPAPWFTNVAADAGLAGVRAKDCVFTDLDGDGYWDLCLDRQRLYRSEKGMRFEAREASGIEFPVIVRTPLAKDGTPDTAKAKEGPYVPQYLYFADVDNDGNQDAVAGVHTWWEHFDGRGWKRVAACDPGVRSTVWLGTGKGRFRKAPASPFSRDDAVGPAMALALLDYDGDGRLDLYEGREYRRYGVLVDCGVDRLWKGDGKGGFEDVRPDAFLLIVEGARKPKRVSR